MRLILSLVLVSFVSPLAFAQEKTQIECSYSAGKGPYKKVKLKAVSNHTTLREGYLKIKNTSVSFSVDDKDESIQIATSPKELSGRVVTGNQEVEILELVNGNYGLMLYCGRDSKDF